MKKVAILFAIMLTAGIANAGEIVNISTNDMQVKITGVEVLEVHVNSQTKDRTVDVSAILIAPEPDEVEGVSLHQKYQIACSIQVTAAEIEAANGGTTITDLTYGVIDTTVRTLATSKFADALNITP